jgi:hypothetical protein
MNEMPEVRLIDANVADKILTELCITIQDTGNVSGVSGTIVKSVRPCVTTGVRAAQVALNNMPTIEAEPVLHGRWIFIGEETMYDGWTYRKHKCTECDFVTVEAKNFCPNCGAKMDFGYEE